jgi:hypothetical protein
MFDRVRLLGQVGITEQAGFGGPAWGVNTPLNPNVRFPAPPGAPATTEENVGRWLCPDGMERVLTEAQARAMGCTRRNLVNMMGQSSADQTVGKFVCPDGSERVLTVAQAKAMGCRSATGVRTMGQAGTPGGPPPGGGAPPTVSVPPTVHDGGFTTQQFDQFQFFQPYWGYPQYPQYPAYPPPQQQQRMVCRKLEDQSKQEGRDVFECLSEPVARPAANYPVYTYPMTAYNWWY